MPAFMTRFPALCIVAAFALLAQDSRELAIAKAMDQEMRKLKDAPDDVRAPAIKDLALRIRQQPRKFAVALASNLANDAVEAVGREILLEVATTLAEALRTSPVSYRTDAAYLNLAELNRYHGVQVSLDDPRFTAAIATLESNDRRRRDADFTLSDLQGRKWTLTALRGKVVLVNFWATWCPPCRRELPDIAALDQRFKGEGLVILAISDEEASTVKRFVADQKIGYTVLLDPGNKVKELFRVDGIPQSFVYDREGRLVAQVHNRPSLDGFLGMLRLAGLN